MIGRGRYADDVPQELFVRRSLMTIRRLCWFGAISLAALVTQRTANTGTGHGTVIGILNNIDSNIATAANKLEDIKRDVSTIEINSH